MAKVVNKFAESLFEVSKNAGVVETVFADLQEIEKALKDNEAFKTFSDNPKVSKDERLAFVLNTFKGVDAPLLNTIKLLADKKQLGLLPEIAKAFSTFRDADLNQAHMKVESVYPLSTEELDAIGASFIKRTGYHKLLIENVINESLVGGIRATIGTTVYDGSVLNDLNRLEKSFHQQ